MSRPEHSTRASRASRSGRVVLLATGLVVAAGALTACTSPTPGAAPPTAAQTPSESASASASAAAPTPTAAVPALAPEGTAGDNLAYFASIVNGVWAGPDNVSGRAYIDALVAGGFDKAAMQVTNDKSTVGNPAESIQFSVVWKGECLVGQVGPATGAPVAVVLPVVGEGACLVGTTRPIDW